MSYGGVVLSCHDCGASVSGSIREHRHVCRRSRGVRAITCYDCGDSVTGSIKEHHAICPKSRRVKSTVHPASDSLAPVVRSKRSAKYARDFADSTDVYFIIDVSGSMGGQRLESAKSSVKTLTSDINPLDRMAIITFDTKAFFKLKPRPVEQILRQNELPGILDRIFAQGLTALYDAVEMAVDQMHNPNKKAILNVLTDGEDNSSHITYAQLLEKLKRYPNITLNIIHVDNLGNTIEAYKNLCSQRGEYLVIKEPEIIEVYTTIFRKYYR